jgi:hypothetical protein
MELVLEITDQHADVICAALDLWARLGTGELTALLNHPDVSKRLTTDQGVTPEDVRRLLENLKTAIFDLKPNAWFGVSSKDISEGNRIAFDLMQVIRHQLAWARAGNPETRTPEMFSVSYDDPLHVSSAPLATIREKPGDIL